jgi:hypothetical protein
MTTLGPSLTGLRGTQVAGSISYIPLSVSVSVTLKLWQIILPFASQSSVLIKHSICSVNFFGTIHLGTEPNQHTTSQEWIRPKLCDTHRQVAHKQLSHLTELAAVSTTAASRASSWRRSARPEEASTIRPAPHHQKNTTVLQHSTITPEHKPIDHGLNPGSWWRRRQGGVVPDQEEKDKPPGAEPGGEGQARSKPQLTSKQ